MKRFLTFVAIVSMFALVACGNDDGADDELLMIEVDFIVPEAVDVGETVELLAEVTYGDEKELDAEVKFEVWEKGDEENSDMLEATNNGDGTYTADYTFDRDGIFEMFAHTDAQHQHVMPKKEIVVGEGGEYDDVDEESAYHTEGFDMHVMFPEQVTAGEEIEIVTHLTLFEEPLADANVRYEIVAEDDEANTDWVDATESEQGEYEATHTFDNAGTYELIVHVEDDEDLHEHDEFTLEVE